MGGGFKPITLEASWAKPRFIDDFLAKQLSSGSASLVVGAGASMAFNLPSWDDLVYRMYDKQGVPIPAKKKSAPILSEMLRSKNFKGDSMGFSELVRTCLYETVQDAPENVLASPLLQAIGSFLANSIRGKAGAIISFNFDDLIEKHLGLLGMVARSEVTAPYWQTRADMQVLHPHGILPSNRAEACTEIVFTESDYDAVIGSSQNAWNQSMNGILVGTTPIFLGLSGEDQRLRTMLTDLRDRHVGTGDGHRYWGVRPCPLTEDEFVVDRWKKMGIAPRFLKSYDEIPSWILSICQKSANLTRSR